MTLSEQDTMSQLEYFFEQKKVEFTELKAKVTDIDAIIIAIGQLYVQSTYTASPATGYMFFPEYIQAHQLDFKRRQSDGLKPDPQSYLTMKVSQLSEPIAGESKNNDPPINHPDNAYAFLSRSLQKHTNEAIAKHLITSVHIAGDLLLDHFKWRLVRFVDTTEQVGIELTDDRYLLKILYDRFKLIEMGVIYNQIK